MPPKEKKDKPKEAPAEEGSKKGEKKKTVSKESTSNIQENSKSKGKESLTESKSKKELAGGKENDKSAPAIPAAQPAIPSEITSIIEKVREELESMNKQFISQLMDAFKDMNTNKDLQKALLDSKTYYRIHEYICTLSLNSASQVFGTLKDSLILLKEFVQQKGQLVDNENKNSQLSALIKQKMNYSNPLDQEKWKKTATGIETKIRDFFKKPLAEETKRTFELITFNNADQSEIERNVSALRMSSSSNVRKNIPHNNNEQRRTKEGIRMKTFSSISDPLEIGSKGRLAHDESEFKEYCQSIHILKGDDVYIKGMGRISSYQTRCSA